MLKRASATAVLRSADYNAALVIIPRGPCFESLQSLRQRCDPSTSGTWMPHVNLLWPLPAREDSQYPQAMSRIRSICSSTAPFQIRLPSLDKETRPYGSSLLFSCPHSEDGTSPHPGLVRLHAELCGAVDFLQPRLNVFHFRLGSVARMEEAHTFARETHRWVPLSFDVSCLSVVTRPGPNQPFEVAEEIFLARVA